MMRRRKKLKAALMKGMCTACAVLLGLTGFLALPADYGLLSRADEELESRYYALSEEDLEEKLAQAEDAAEAQELILQELQTQILALNEEMQELSGQIRTVSGEITAKEAEITSAQEALAQAQERQQEQYDNMKLRIQYMYENQDSGLLTASLSGSLRDLLTAVEYVTQITGYDREKLNEYRSIQEEITEKEAELQAQYAELEALKTELEEKQAQTAECIQVVQANVAACTAALSQYQTDMTSISGQIALRDTLLAQLEESVSVAESESAEASARASEEAAAYEASVQESVEASIAESLAASAEASREAEEDGTQTAETHASAESGGDFSGGTDGMSDSELDMLAAIIYCEAQGEGYEGKVGVGNVVLNRMVSGSFPDTMLEVLYQSNQFAPVTSGSFAIALAFKTADESCYEAAQDALNGVNTAGDSLYFKRASGDETGGLVIGNIYFY